MKVKELIEILEKYPDDMEVMDYNDVSGPFPMRPPRTDSLQFIKHYSYNGRPREWLAWNYKSIYPLYDAELIKEEVCLLFDE